MALQCQQTVISDSRSRSTGCLLNGRSSLRWRLLLTRNNYRSAVMLSLSGMAEFSMPHHDRQFAHLKCGPLFLRTEMGSEFCPYLILCGRKPKNFRCSILKSYICISEKFKRNFLWVINFLLHHQSLKQSCKNRSSDQHPTFNLHQEYRQATQKISIPGNELGWGAYQPLADARNSWGI